MTQPLNLKELYTGRYRFVLDESALHEKGGRRNPWYFQIPCMYGHIYPHSDKLLGFCCESGRIIAKLRNDHPELPIPQDGDGAAIFLFTLDQFDVVAEYAKPRKKRRISEAQKTRLRQIGFSGNRTQNDTLERQNRVSGSGVTGWVEEPENG